VKTGRGERFRQEGNRKSSLLSARFGRGETSFLSLSLARARCSPALLRKAIALDPTARNERKRAEQRAASSPPCPFLLPLRSAAAPSLLLSLALRSPDSDANESKTPSH